MEHFSLEKGFAEQGKHFATLLRDNNFEFMLKMHSPDSTFILFSSFLKL